MTTSVPSNENELVMKPESVGSGFVKVVALRLTLAVKIGVGGELVEEEPVDVESSD